jgi:hypothetical protein
MSSAAAAAGGAPAGGAPAAGSARVAPVAAAAAAAAAGGAAIVRATEDDHREDDHREDDHRAAEDDCAVDYDYDSDDDPNDQIPSLPRECVEKLLESLDRWKAFAYLRKLVKRIATNRNCEGVDHCVATDWATAMIKYLSIMPDKNVAAVLSFLRERLENHIQVLYLDPGQLNVLCSFIERVNGGQPELAHLALDLLIAPRMWLVVDVPPVSPPPRKQKPPGADWQYSYQYDMPPSWVDNAARRLEMQKATIAKKLPIVWDLALKIIQIDSQRQGREADRSWDRKIAGLLLQLREWLHCLCGPSRNDFTDVRSGIKKAVEYSHEFIRRLPHFQPPCGIILISHEQLTPVPVQEQMGKIDLFGSELTAKGKEMAKNLIEALHAAIDDIEQGLGGGPCLLSRDDIDRLRGLLDGVVGNLVISPEILPGFLLRVVNEFRPQNKSYPAFNLFHILDRLLEICAVLTHPAVEEWVKIGVPFNLNRFLALKALELNELAPGRLDPAVVEVLPQAIHVNPSGWLTVIWENDAGDQMAYTGPIGELVTFDHWDLPGGHPELSHLQLRVRAAETASVPVSAARPATMP